MKITTKIVYLKEEEIYLKKGTFFSDDVSRWVEGDLDGTIEVFFHDGSSVVIFDDFDEFSKMINGQDKFWSSAN